MAKNEKKPGFDKDERVLCFHGPLLYEAKIIKRERREDTDEAEGTQYLIHYKGWKQSWDEWVPEERVLKWNDANLQKQQQLKEQHARRKPSRATSLVSSIQTASDSSELRGRKRQRDSSVDRRGEEDASRQHEFQLEIPESLKGRLVDDWENVTKNRQLTQLPSTPSVSEILAQYADECDSQDEATRELLRGIQLYFDKSLGPLLLYNAERKQHEDVINAYPDKHPSDLYGINHLLRLFVEMPSLMSQSNVDPETLMLARDTFTAFLSFLQKHEQTLFPE